MTTTSLQVRQDQLASTRIVEAADAREAVAAEVGEREGDVLHAAALQGLGLVYLPSFIVGPDVQASALVSLLPDFVPTDTAIHAVYPHSRHLSPKVRVFIDLMAEYFGERHPWSGAAL